MKSNLNKTRKWMVAVAFAMLSANCFAANEIVKTTQVKGNVSITQNQDYVITDQTPFASVGSLNIENTEHAVVIIQEIKPSKVIKDWLDHVNIKGGKAQDGQNCQVKMYGRGTIILPYDKDIHPLTCFTGKDFSGKSCNNYTEGHNGNGYMKALNASTLDNKIKSFKLKRGYMVTFALGLEGWGYSRCFIADNEDLEINLPENMASRVSSYRLFKWQNAKKGNLASADYKYLNLVNATSGFGWNQGHNLLPDMECVPNHIYEGYPSVSDIGKATWACHSKNNNEPGNSADDHPQDVATVLGNWQNVMRTGLRLCSESSHDGSMNHLQAFLDSIDARGWRCDIIDMHCYWNQGQFNNLTNISNRYGKRPIWISEWLWGAWWSGQGIFSLVKDAKDFSEAAQKKLYEGTRPILEKLNGNPRVERYYYWNAEERTSLWSKDGADTLSMLGKYYANMQEPLAFNRQYEYVPKVVYASVTDLKASLQPETNEVKLSWNDPNGDMLDSVVVMCQRPGKMLYEHIANIPMRDANSINGTSYTFTDKAPNGTNKYCIAIYPIGSTQPRRSATTTVLVISRKAVWNDVTSNYVVNANFDDEREFSSNLTTGKDNHKAVNGWITDNNSDLGCSGVFGVASGNTLNKQTVPQTNADNMTAGGVLGINQGWGTPICYTQKIKLPAGTYRFSYAAYNAANTIQTGNLCGYKIGCQGFVYDDYTTLEPGSWNLFHFSPLTLMKETEVELSLGYVAANTTSTNNPFLFYDYIKVEKADLSKVDDAGYEAVYVDVTDKYLKNSGFDFAQDFQKDDVKNGKTNHLKATNWTTANNGDFGASAVFGIGSHRKLNGQEVPDNNTNGKAEGGCLGVSQGWEIDATYKQQTLLPAGTYRMSYSVFNVANDETEVNNHCGYQLGNKANIYDNLNKFNVGTWTIRMLDDFTINEPTNATFSLGYKAAKATSSKNPFIFFDYIKLEQCVDKREYEKTTNIKLSPGKTDHKSIEIYNQEGIRLPALQRGVNIIRYADGSSTKVFRK